MRAHPDAIRRAFGRELRLRRTALGLSQEAVAHEAGLSLRHVSELERGAKMPSLATVIALAEALDCPAGELVTRAADGMA